MEVEDSWRKLIDDIISGIDILYKLIKRVSCLFFVLSNLIIIDHEEMDEKWVRKGDKKIDNVSYTLMFVRQTD